LRTPYTLSSPNADHRDLPPFPTRRSSDLVRITHTSQPGDEAPQLTSMNEQQLVEVLASFNATHRLNAQREILRRGARGDVVRRLDRKSTRLNSSHVKISYAVFCLKKKIHP